MKHLLLPLLLAISTVANAQFRYNTDKPEQIGISTGLCYWNSNFKNNTPALGIDESIFYRKEYHRLAVQVGLDYSTYQRSLNYQETIYDGQNSSKIAYDHEKLSAYATIVALQYGILKGVQLRSYIGLYINPVYYYYNIHRVPGTEGNNADGGGIRVGCGFTWYSEYRISAHLYLNGEIRLGYLKIPDMEFDQLHKTPEYKESLLFGIAYRL